MIFNYFLKLNLFLVLTCLSYKSTAQVGMNTTTPKASLDIRASNQASPLNTDGLLIPRIDTFPAINPTFEQQGMMVYLTTTLGLNDQGYYYWDNGVGWKSILVKKAKGFYEAGGTPPNDINDDIYTYGKVNIGTTDFTTSTTLKINTSETTGAFIQNNNTSTPNGLTLSLPADNANIKTGLSVNLSGINSNAFISSGIKTNFSTTGTNNSLDGIQQNFIGNSTNGIIKGLNNNFSSSSSYRTIIGISNNIESEGIGEHIGISNYLSGIATGKQKGNETIIDNSADGHHYGNYNILSGTGSGNKYGTYNLIETTANGTHYGVYSEVLSATGYAGYFNGRVSIGTTDSNNYILPSTRGTNGQVMRTNGSGNLSWVTPTLSDADWFEVGTSNPPNSINDHIFTQGKVGVGINDPSAGIELIYTSDNGTNPAYNRDGMKIDYTHTRNSGIGTGLNIIAKSTENSNVAAGYFQVYNSNNSTSSIAVKAFNTASSTNNIGLSASALGSGGNNYGIKASALGGSNNNWAGFFGNNTTGDGNVFIEDLLKVEGSLTYTNGAIDGYILKTDASGNATWADPTTIFTDSDNQQIDLLSLSGTTLNLSLQDDGVAPYTLDLSSIQDGTGTDNQNLTSATLTGTSLAITIENGVGTTVDLTPLQDTDWYEAGGTPPNNINDNIYTNGKVGINNVSPSSSLDIVSNSSGSIGQLSVTESDASDGARILFKNAVETSRKWTVYAKADDTAADNFFNIHNTSTGNILIVRGNGKVGINRTPTTNALEVNGQASKSSAGSWIGNSDRRLKKNIIKIEGKTALEIISKMKGVTYLWNDTKTGIDRPTEIQYGFIAQELMQLFPEKVTKDSLGYYQTAYGDYDPIFVEAIKELNTKLEILENENQQLKNQLKKYEDLEARLSALENNSTIPIND